MTASLPSSPSVGFISLGCAKNLVDSEHMAAVLRSEGIGLASSPETADVVLVNTCGFIGDAKTESIDAILRACAWKQSGACKAVVVAGCLIQRYKKELQRAIPEVDAFIGLDQLPEIGRLVRRLALGEHGILTVSAVSRKIFSPLPSRLVLTGGPFAYLKIAEGCNHRCAFCAIPGIRGRYRSRSEDDVVREAETLLGQGIRELNLISQDTTRYGQDRKDGTSLPRLLRQLGKIGGDFWIRLLYGHPAYLTDELLDCMGAVPQVCRYLDIPIQHADEQVLRAMQRPGGARAVRDYPERARARLPGVVLRTTCLVGFPGETARQFQELVRFVRHTEFDHLGVFAFSPEETTMAATMKGQVSASTGRRRREHLMTVQQEIAFRKASVRRGGEDLALLLKPLRRNVWEARVRGQAPAVDGLTRVSGCGAAAKPGDRVPVRYTGASGYDMKAQVI
ncbi:MAG: 30S ribosomal protein S12 methylthiotransferase RimO [bacterium]